MKELMLIGFDKASSTSLFALSLPCMYVLSKVFMETDARLGRAVCSLAWSAWRSREQRWSERHQKRFRQQMLRTEPRITESTSTCEEVMRVTPRLV